MAEVTVGTLDYTIVGEEVTVYKETNGDPLPVYARCTVHGHIEWQAMMAASSTDQQILDACDTYLKAKGWC